MKKIFRKIGRFFKAIGRGIYKALDVVIITPLSKFAYFITDKLNNRNGRLDKFLSRPNTSYISNTI